MRIILTAAFFAASLTALSGCATLRSQDDVGTRELLAAAGFQKGPILLVQHDCIPFNVDITIQRLNPTQVIVLGGTAALSDAVLNRTVC